MSAALHGLSLVAAHKSFDGDRARRREELSLGGDGKGFGGNCYGPNCVPGKGDWRDGNAYPDWPNPAMRHGHSEQSQAMGSSKPDPRQADHWPSHFEAFRSFCPNVPAGHEACIDESGATRARCSFGGQPAGSAVAGRWYPDCLKSPSDTSHNRQGAVSDSKQLPTSPMDSAHQTSQARQMSDSQGPPALATTPASRMPAIHGRHSQKLARLQDELTEEATKQGRHGQEGADPSQQDETAARTQDQSQEASPPTTRSGRGPGHAPRSGRRGELQR